MKGRNIEENEYVKVNDKYIIINIFYNFNLILNFNLQMGAYHTIDLELNRKFTLMKEEWDSVDLERIEIATDPTQVLKTYIYVNTTINS